MQQSVERLTQMANDIANNLSPGKTPDAAAAAIADHMRRFWAPSMRETLRCNKSDALHSNALLALDLLARDSDA